MNYRKNKTPWIKKKRCLCAKKYCTITFSFVEQYQNVEGTVTVSDLFYAPYAWDGSAFLIPDTDAEYMEYSIDGSPFIRIETLAAEGNYYNLTNYDTEAFPTPSVPVIHEIEIRVNKTTSFIKFNGILDGLPSSDCSGVDVYFNGYINGISGG